jgi:hypothetical protein
MRMILSLSFVLWTAVAAAAAPKEIEEYVQRCQRERAWHIEDTKKTIENIKQVLDTPIPLPGAAQAPGLLKYFEQRLATLQDPMRAYHAPIFNTYGPFEHLAPEMGAIGMIEFSNVKVVDEMNFLAMSPQFRQDQRIWVKGLATKDFKPGVEYKSAQALKLVETKVLSEAGRQELVYVLEPVEVPDELYAQFAELAKAPATPSRQSAPPQANRPAPAASAAPPANVPAPSSVPASASPAQTETAKAKPQPKKAREFEVRLWKDATGKFSIEAKLSGLAGGVVKLKRADGSVISVPVEKLSEEDRAYLDELKK